MRSDLSPFRPGRVWAVLAVALALALPLATGCSDEDCQTCPAPAQTGTVVLSFAHVSGGVPLIQNQMIYQNAAGYDYSLTKLEYLLTDIKLQRGNGDMLDVAAVYREDLFESLPGKAVDGLAVRVPAGDYSRLVFQWGKKWEGSIGATEVLGAEYEGLLWQVPLGGGYHCMRFEGNFDTQVPEAETGSFKLHTGRLHAMIPESDPPARYEEIVDGSILVEFDLSEDLTVADGEVWNVEVVIDVNEFMTEDYDFMEERDTESGRGTWPLSGPVMPSYPAQRLLLGPIDADEDGVYDGGTVFSLGDITNVTGTQ